MEIGKKWVISDEVLKESFDKLEIEEVFFSKFKEKAIDKLNDFACDSVPTLDDTDESIDIALEYIKEYASQIRKGKSEIYAHAYAVNMEFQEVYCIIFAKAYECAIAHGQDKTKAFCFGDFCSNASDQGYWLNLDDFVERFQEDWQKKYYIDLVLQEYKQLHHCPMAQNEYELLKGKLYK